MHFYNSAFANINSTPAFVSSIKGYNFYFPLALEKRNKKIEIDFIIQSHTRFSLSLLNFEQDIVIEKESELSTGQQTMQLNFNAMQAGTYFLKIVSNKKFPVLGITLI